ncbi:MAG: DUF1016 domain-containing protein [Leptolyngbya sp. SIOISBB]|nr:DUF1016 domain-containing protein [Leptolyngbya sp. SIOISBB]
MTWGPRVHITDLLFYHIRLRCFVVIQLRWTAFSRNSQS